MIKNYFTLFYILLFSSANFNFAEGQTTNKRESKSRLVTPRQKILFSGNLNQNIPGELSLNIDEINALVPLESVKIKDPYNRNLETTFTGPSLKSLVAHFSSFNIARVDIVAIDGYVSKTPIDDIMSANLILATKDQNGYISVDRMGPARILNQIKGVLDDKDEISTSIYWTWQVKEIRFVSEELTNKVDSNEK